MPSRLVAARPALVCAYLAAGLVFAGHLALGANRANLALALSAAWFAFLAALIVSRPWARQGIQATRLTLIGVPFAGLLLLTALSLTSMGAGGAHPIWSFTPGISATVSIDPYATVVEIIKLLALAAAFLVGVALGADDDSARRAMRALLLVGTAYCAWAFVDHALEPKLLFGTDRHFDPGRLSASFGSSNTAATLFGALALLNIVDLIRTHESVRPARRLHVGDIQRVAPPLARPLLALALAATCLILTESRAGIAVTVGVGVALLGAVGLTRSRPTALAAPIVGAVVLGLALASVALNLGALQQRLLFVSADTLGRSQIFAAHWSAFEAAPLSGYGLGSFAHVNAMIMDQTNLAALKMIGAAHNVYIQWLEEAGVLGAAAMFATMGMVVLELAIGVVRRRRMRGWLIAIAGVLLLFLLHGASDYALEVPSMALFLSLLLGVGVGCAAQGATLAPPTPSRTRVQTAAASAM
jgi:O-antigen ligase